MPAEERLGKALGELRVVRELEANEGHLTPGMVEGTVAGRASLLQGRSAPAGDPVERHVVRAKSLQSRNPRRCRVPIWSHADANRARGGGWAGRKRERAEGKTHANASRAKPRRGRARASVRRARVWAGGGRSPPPRRFRNVTPAQRILQVTTLIRRTTDSERSSRTNFERVFSGSVSRDHRRVVGFANRALASLPPAHQYACLLYTSDAADE